MPIPLLRRHIQQFRLIAECKLFVFLHIPVHVALVLSQLRRRHGAVRQAGVVEPASVSETAAGLQVEDFEVVEAEAGVVQQMGGNWSSRVDGEVAELLLLGRRETREGLLHFRDSRGCVCDGHADCEQSIVDQDTCSGGDVFERERAAVFDTGVSELVVAMVSFS